VHEPNDRTEVLRSSIIATFLKPIRVDEARRIIEWRGSNRLDQSSFVTRCGHRTNSFQSGTDDSPTLPIIRAF